MKSFAQNVTLYGIAILGLSPIVRKSSISRAKTKRRKRSRPAIKVRSMGAGDMLYSKECVICGRKFAAMKVHMKYCSEECRRIKLQQKYAAQSKIKRENNIKPKVCLNCGETFMPNKSGDRIKYCSIKCGTEAHCRARREETARKVVTPRQCLKCGKMFLPSVDGGMVKYCSVECRYANGLLQQKKRNEVRIIKDRAKRAEVKNKFKGPNAEIAEMNDKALAVNLSYGMYVIKNYYGR